jgi:hypothetical protein
VRCAIWSKEACGPVSLPHEVQAGRKRLAAVSFRHRGWAVAAHGGTDMTPPGGRGARVTVAGARAWGIRTRCAGDGTGDPVPRSTLQLDIHLWESDATQADIWTTVPVRAATPSLPQSAHPAAGDCCLVFVRSACKFAALGS